MKKLNRALHLLYESIDEIDKEIEKYENKIEAIEDNASDKDRDLTESEESRISGFEDKVDELTAMRDDVEEAISYIGEYAVDERGY